MRAMFLFLAGLLSAPAEPATIAAGSIKRFGVVSVVADKFARSYIGLTAFTNEVEEIDVTAWGIDAAYPINSEKSPQGCSAPSMSLRLTLPTNWTRCWSSAKIGAKCRAPPSREYRWEFKEAATGDTGGCPSPSTSMTALPDTCTKPNCCARLRPVSWCGKSHKSRFRVAS
jgi:hypothetical protein